MNRTLALLLGFVCWAVISVHAEYSVKPQGTWPKSWPRELEPLRKQARTFEGPLAPYQHHAIPFTKREEFEAAWPYLLKVKSQGAGIRLVRAPNFFLGDHSKSGVVVHCPLPPGQASKNADPKDQTYIELIVDGDIVDLNRIFLPADTSITDERFKDAKNK
jgi:hypothetical protein